MLVIFIFASLASLAQPQIQTNQNESKLERNLFILQDEVSGGRSQTQKSSRYNGS